MDALFENNLNHNAALGATVLWSFTAAYYKQRDKQAGPSLPELMLALPVAFHSASVAAIYSKNRDGALPKALAEERAIAAGIQQRLEGYADRTLRSLHLALAADLLVLTRTPGLTFLPGRLTRPYAYDSEELQQIISAADRLGHWVALSGFETASSLLGVRF